ncbi:MAG: hypothetical protein KGL46_09460 [Hyphomicrobiales bacterium]|nr:hypothetical protein [Hyphomicrobiales bacterium]
MPQADALARQCLERAPANAESALVREKLFAEIVRLNRLRIRIEPHEGALRPVVGAARDIVAFVQALPLEEREALLVVALGGFSYGAAARILAAPRAVVVTRLARARAALDAAERGPVARVGHLRIVK